MLTIKNTGMIYDTEKIDREKYKWNKDMEQKSREKTKNKKGRARQRKAKGQCKKFKW